MDADVSISPPTRRFEILLSTAVSSPIITVPLDVATPTAPPTYKLLKFVNELVPLAEIIVTAEYPEYP